MADNIEEELDMEKGGILAEVPQAKSRGRVIIITLIIIILIGGNIYFAYSNNKLKKENIEEVSNSFSLGIQYGHKAVLLEIYNKAVTCEPVQITNEGAVINLLDTKCLSG